MVRLEIPITSQEQLRHIWKAEYELLKAGVIFNVGGDLVYEKPTTWDWELDWSLRGAKLIIREEK